MDQRPDELRIARQRQSDVEVRADQVNQDAPEEGSVALARTKAVGTYPTAANRYFAMSPVTVGGVEGEGNPGTFTVESGTFFALNIGSAVPPVGTDVIVEGINGRWVFEFNG